MDGLSRVIGLVAVVMIVLSFWYPGVTIAACLMMLVALALTGPRKEK